MRWNALAFILALLAAPALSEEETGRTDGAKVPTLAELESDSATQKGLRKGIKLARDYFKARFDLAAGKKRASAGKVERAREAWRNWIGEASADWNFNLKKHPHLVVEILNEGRKAVIKSEVKLRKGRLDVGNRLEPNYSRGSLKYAVLVPKDYDHVKVEQPLPLVVSLHGRAINLRHPALKKFPEERSRIVVWNNWGGDGKSPQANAIVVAPNGRPDGFRWSEEPEVDFFVKQTAFLAQDVGCTNYRVDPHGVFLEVYGDAIETAIEMHTVFAGIIWRDREDSARPIAEPSIFKNLGNKPLFYIADAAKWDTVGSKNEAALRQYYKGDNANNLVVLKVDRDANSALKHDPEKMNTFLQRRLPKVTKELHWYFWRPSLTGPLPLSLARADYDYDDEWTKDKALLDKCGLIKMKASTQVETVEGKQVPYNLLDFEIYESEAMTLFLYEGLVNFDLPITVRVNGKILQDKVKMKRDWLIFEKFCMSRMFFAYPIVNTISLEFPLRARVPEPEKKDEAGAEGAETATEGASADAGNG